MVFVLEGRDDLKAYDVWIRRIAPEMKWEPLIANGKKNSLAFRSMLDRDTTGLNVCTYFIIDHDYDGMAGAPNGEDVYILPAHSVENVLTHPDVVAALLTTEFRLLGDPQTKQNIIEMYRLARGQFVSYLRPGCEMLHASKRSAPGNVLIDENCNKYFGIMPNSTILNDRDGLTQLIRTEQVLSDDAVLAAKKFFDEADGGVWVRGKYLLAFMKEWGVKLMQDRQSAAPEWFREPSPGHGFSGEWCEISALAGKSHLPSGLSTFVEVARQRCIEACGHM